MNPIVVANGLPGRVMVRACPQCHSIDLKHSKNDQSPGFGGFVCLMCGKIFYRGESEIKEFTGEKKPPRKKPEEPWLFPEERKNRV